MQSKARRVASCVLPLVLVATPAAAQTPAPTGKGDAPPGAAEPPEPAVVHVGRRTTFSADTSQQDAQQSLSISREAQKELHRVGCYDGELSGYWTPSTQQAAQRFIDRVNARLPVSRPDAVLLALLQAQPGTVCGSCPPGQGLDAAGRCLPTALLKKPMPAPVVTGSLWGSVETTRSEPTTGAPAVASDQPPAPAAAPPTQPTGHGSALRANTKPTTWQKFMRSVDKALGFN